MRGLGVAFALVSIGWSQYAASQNVSKSPVIWNNLVLGMSHKEVKALYPKKEVEVTPGCSASVNPVFLKGVLSEVTLQVSKSSKEERCDEIVLKTLMGKYGDPGQIEHELKPQSCGDESARGLEGVGVAICKSAGGDRTLHLTYARWIHEGIQISLTTDDAMKNSWELNYRLDMQPAKASDTKL